MNVIWVISLSLLLVILPLVVGYLGSLISVRFISRSLRPDIVFVFNMVFGFMLAFVGGAITLLISNFVFSLFDLVQTFGHVRLINSTWWLSQIALVAVGYVARDMVKIILRRH